MRTIVKTTSTALLALALPAVATAQSSYYSGDQNYAHQACKNKEDNRQILGGIGGAVIGGVLGSQVSGRGARTEGSAIGAVLGGLAGAGIADKAIDCDPVYAPQGARTYSGAQPTSYYGQQSQPTYTDTVTYSNHPVYSQPSYGAGAVNYGTTYETQSISYPPYNNNTSHAGTTYASVPYSGSTTTSSGYHSNGYHRASYPVATTTSYPSSSSSYYPAHTGRVVSYSAPRPSGPHYHGKYACSAYH